MMASRAMLTKLEASEFHAVAYSLHIQWEYANGDSSNAFYSAWSTHEIKGPKEGELAFVLSYEVNDDTQQINESNVLFGVVRSRGEVDRGLYDKLLQFFREQQAKAREKDMTLDLEDLTEFAKKK